MTPEQLEQLLHDSFPDDDDVRRLQVESADEERVRLRLDHHAAHLRPGGTVSGPTMMKLADTAAWLVLLRRLGEAARRATTVNLDIHFLRRPGPVDLIAEAVILRAGRRLARITVDLFSEGEPRPVARATVTYALDDRG